MIFFQISFCYQVLGEVIDELSVVQILVIVKVVLKHGRDLLRSHNRSTHTHRKFTCLRAHTHKPTFDTTLKTFP